MTYKKRISAFALSVVLLFSIFTHRSHASAETVISAQAAILIDADSGQVLFEKNISERLGMASTTKIMTALTVLRLTEPSETVTISKEAVGIEGSSVYLCEGEKMTVEQLLYALLLSSANDAAVALSVFSAGSVDSFVTEMNAYAAELGARNTHFVNPHGLADSEHYTTAYDLALISRVALNNELLRTIFSTYKKSLPFNGEENKRLAVNHNRLLKSYEGAVGIKTGYTKATGRCLVSAAERDGLTLICVTLNSPNDWQEHAAMLDYGFENYTRYVFADTGDFLYSIPVVGGENDSTTLTNTEPIALTVKRNEKQHVGATVMLNCRFLYAPIQSGDIWGTVTVNYGDTEISSPLKVTVGVSAKDENKSLWQRIIDIFKKD